MRAALPGTLSLQAVTITAPSKREDPKIELAGAQETCSRDRWGHRGLGLSQADAGDDHVGSGGWGEMPASPGPGLWGPRGAPASGKASRRSALLAEGVSHGEERQYFLMRLMRLVACRRQVGVRGLTPTELACGP